MKVSREIAKIADKYIAADGRDSIAIGPVSNIESTWKTYKNVISAALLKHAEAGALVALDEIDAVIHNAARQERLR